jgi:hypothetical protein
MGMQTDVKAAYKAGAGSAYGAPTRLKGVYMDLSGAGTLELTDGNGGATLLKLTTIAAPTQNPVYVPIPGEGIKFDSGIYVKTATNITAVTVFYG